MISLFWSFVSVMTAFVVGGIIYRKTSGKCTSKNKMNGKIVLITGGSAGIGKYTALDLARRGAKVIITCRDMKKGQSVADWIINETGNPNVELYHLDLSDFESVKSFSTKLRSSENKLDVLINNAGMSKGNKKESAQGFELTFASNYLGPFLLTHLLIDLLERPSRIINVSSIAHKHSGLHLKDLNCKNRKYSEYSQYSMSKLCNVLFTNQLAVKLKEKGITVNSLHPGIVATSLPGRGGNVTAKFVEWVFYIVGKNSEQGAQTSIHLAVSDDVTNVTGEYFVDCKIADKSKDGKDLLLAKELWDVSEKMVDLETKDKF